MTTKLEITVPLNASVRVHGRRLYISQYSWAIPSELALEKIADYSGDGVLELGAGTGYWAALLSSRGVDVVAVDPQAYLMQYKWIDVQPFDHTIARHPSTWKRSLLMVWPSRGKRWPSEVLRFYRGSVVIYVGSPETVRNNQACATPLFFRLLQRDFRLAEIVAIPNWRDQKDRMEIWIRGDASAGNQGGEWY